MRRSCKLTLRFATIAKKQKIFNLLQEYRRVVNFFIKSLWETPGKLDKETLARCKNTRLSERYKSQALKQALEIVVSTRKAAKLIKKMVSLPIFDGSAVLDSKFITIEEGKGSFDLVVKLSTLKKGKRIVIPTRKTRTFNKWLSKPNAKLIQGCCLCEDKLIVWIEVPNEEPKEEGNVLGIDIGVNKLISTSDGSHYGTEFKFIRDKINRRKPGSKGKQKAFRERTNYINQEVKKLPWNELKAIGVEDLKDLKKGKKSNRSKAFRKALAPWTYRQVINSIDQKAQENRVCLVRVNPAKTSQTCPSCSMVDKLNRKGEHFQCVVCNYANDSDTVGALNVLTRTLEILRSVESLRAKEVVNG
jgi:IS605 OrfB family transposase